MAVIGKIRKHSGLLIVVIGVALLAFILGDFTKSNTSTTDVGVVDGEKISYLDYNRRIEQYTNNVRNQRGQNPSGEDLYQIRNTAWDDIVKEIIMLKEYDELGITVTAEELFDQIQGENPHSGVKQAFTNPETGAFDREQVMLYLQNLDNMPLEQRNMWLTFEKYVQDDRLETKYKNLLYKGFYAPQALLRQANIDKNAKASAEIVALRYNTIPDSTIVLTNKDYEVIYNERKSTLERPEMRDIEYITFDIKPSQEDIQNTSSQMDELMPQFIETTDMTAFMRRNSDIPYDTAWYGLKELPVELESEFAGKEIGFVYGPYFENNTFKAARLMGEMDRSDSLNANHILIAYEGALNTSQTRSKERAQTIADSLTRVLKKQPNKFKELSDTFSDDMGAKAKGGELGWFRDGQMVPQFNEFVMNNKKGTIGVVETQFGYHVVSVIDHTEKKPKVKYALFAINVVPSSKTYQDIYAQASKFASENRTKEKFDTTIAEQGLNKRVASNLQELDFRITGLENPREVVRWAFDKKTSVGDVSSIFDLSDKYVVAVLAKKYSKGIIPLEEAKEMLQLPAMNRKKADMLIEKMKPYGTDIDKIIAELGAEKQTVSDITFDGRNIRGFGQEPEIVGCIWGLQNGEISEPLRGNSAVYIVKPIEHRKSDTENLQSIENEKRSQFTNAVRNNQDFDAIKKTLKIEDDRARFF
ncbi:MAG: SurA N-terminal domain-containing protein [Lentimicrobiaceae bacterium]|jgi:peptidyl-prolyl cis-trans isomerase D|nr:SurA N-terminal domain-containing protein [Lentimicrobiaceae bacterium]